MTDRARWAAVVVNYESGPLLLECVDSLLADTSAGEPELVVVDNGSDDGSIAQLRAEHPEVAVVRTGGEPRLLGRREPRHCGDARTGRRGVQLRRPRARRHRRRGARTLRSPSPTSAPSARRTRDPTARRTRRPGPCRTSRDAVGHARRRAV